MPIAYTWQFESLDVFPTYQTVTDAVESMHWRLTADDGLVGQINEQIIADCTTKEAAINAATTVDELMEVLYPTITNIQI